MQIKQLTEIGLTDGEARVYTSLLSLGSTTVGPLVKKSGIAYSNIYEVLNRLMKKGLASFALKSGTKYFQPASPENLLDYLEKKETEIKNQKAFLTEMMPKLKGLQQSVPDQEAEIFLGLKGLKAAYAKMISYYSGGEWFFFYSHKHAYAQMADRFYMSISKMMKPADNVRAVVDNSAKQSKFIKYSKRIKWIKYRFVEFPVPTNVDIYKNKALFISWSPEPVAFLITSENIASMFREYFESAWKSVKKYT